MGRDSVAKERNEDAQLTQEWVKKLLGLFHGGLRNVKAGDIAQYLGVSKPTLYKYYSSKDEIVSAVVGYTIDTIEEKNKNLGKTHLSFKQRYLDFMLNSLEISLLVSNELLDDLKTYYPKDFERILNMVKDCDNQFYDFYKEGIEKGIVRNIHPSVITLSNHRVLTEILQPNFLMQNELTFQDAFNSFVQLQLYGIFTDGNEESVEIQKTLKAKLKEIIESHNKGN